MAVESGAIVHFRPSSSDLVSALAVGKETEERVARLGKEARAYLKLCCRALRKATESNVEYEFSAPELPTEKLTPAGVAVQRALGEPDDGYRLKLKVNRENVWLTVRNQKVDTGLYVTVSLDDGDPFDFVVLSAGESREAVEYGEAHRVLWHSVDARASVAALVFDMVMPVLKDRLTTLRLSSLQVEG